MIFATRLSALVPTYLVKLGLCLCLLPFSLVHAQDVDTVKQFSFKYQMVNEMGYLHNFNDSPDKRYNSAFVNGYYEASSLLPTMNLAKLQVKDNRHLLTANIGLAIPYGSLVRFQSFSFSGINEFNIGLQLNPTFSLEAGLLPCDFKYESLISSQNINATRSISALSTYYNYLGARLNAAIPNSTWRLSAFLLNTQYGIVSQLRDNNQHQLGISAKKGNVDDKFQFQTTFLLGLYDSLHNAASEQNFYYNMSWLSYQVAPKLKLALSGDVGFRDYSRTYTDAWFVALNAMAQYKISEKLAVGGRTQWFNDPETKFISYSGFGINLDDDDELKVKAFLHTLNIDWQIHPLSVLRLEGGFYSSNIKTIFLRDPEFSSNIFYADTNKSTYMNLSLVTKLGNL